MTSTIIILLGFSSAFLYFLAIQALRARRTYFFSVVDPRDLVGKIAWLVFGIALVLSGTEIFSRSWFLSKLIGSLLCVWGTQLALWSLGFSLPLLGNKPEYTESIYSTDTKDKPQLATGLEDQSRKSALTYHLNAVIGMLKYVQSREIGNYESFDALLKSEVQDIFEIISDDPDLARPFSETEHWLSDFFTTACVLRFESPQSATEILPALEKARERLRYA